LKRRKKGAGRMEENKEGRENEENECGWVGG
jgi:hypothetical protein